MAKAHSTVADRAATRDRAGSGSVSETVQAILSCADREMLQRVIGKSIAISSGKGGVGKTITTCNLAISYARKGLRIGLVDLDPLSDVASLLDLHESEQAIDGPGAGRLDDGEGFKAHLLPVFRGLDILFPFQKLTAAEVGGLMENLYRRYLDEFDDRYDLLLFDMPAGMSYDDNLAYLPFMKRLVLVTNPEPTAHASAGAYAKEVQRLYPATEIYLWHNRYTSSLKDGFHPSDVAGNYNRFVDLPDRLTAGERALMRDFAFVPEDPALDLLKGEPSPVVHVLKGMNDSLDHLHGRLLAQAARRLELPNAVKDLVAFYLHRHPRIGQPGQYVESLGGYLEDIVLAVAREDPDAPAGDPGPAERMQPFTPGQRSELEGFLRRIKTSPLRREILHLQDVLAERTRRVEDGRRVFAGGLSAGQDRAVDREIGRFLVTMNRSAHGNALMKSHGALLLFHFSLYKLFQSRTLIRLLQGLIPRKKNRQGRMVRDRYRQIRILVEGDPRYRERYLKTMRTLYLVVRRQLTTVADAFELHDLLLKDGEAQIDGRAYLKLITSFLHETLYSGLSVVVGFDFRSAAAAFRDAAERLLASLETVTDHQGLRSSSRE